MRRTIVTVALLVLLAIPASVMAQTTSIRCGPDAGPTPALECYSGPVGIEIASADHGFHFYPPRTFVRAGTTITWTNVDSGAHTITADDGSFASGVIEPGTQFGHTFNYAGGFTYHCHFHANQGSFGTPRVIVTA